MDHVHHVFDAFGKVKVLADEVGLPIQTVCSWRKNAAGKPNIPAWRRADVLAALNRRKLTVPPETLAWLAGQGGAA